MTKCCPSEPSVSKVLSVVFLEYNSPQFLERADDSGALFSHTHASYCGENMSTNITPKQRARPLDQANSETCTLHAVVNATGEKLMDINIDVKLDELIGGMKQLEFIDVENGNAVKEYDASVVRRMTDQNTGNLYDLKLKIKERSVIDKGFLRRIKDKTATCVLVYSQGGQDDPDPDDFHCVFISKVITELGKLQFVCINSWGNYNEIVVKEVDRPHNRVFEVLVDATKSESPRTLANSKTTCDFDYESECEHYIQPVNNLWKYAQIIY